MTAEIHSLMRPDPEAMIRHLDHLFGGYLDGYQDGLIELAWTQSRPDEGGKYRLTNAQLFGTDQIEELVELACKVNQIPKTNVYIGAALRKPGTPLTGRTKDSDFYALTSAYCDLDDADANHNAKSRFADAKPTFVVCTGRHPHWRHQPWWRLSEPVTDPGRMAAMIKGIAVHMSGDGAVHNPGRVMRLAGGIAWDQKPGRVPEPTSVTTLREAGPPAYLPEHIELIYKPLYDFQTIREQRASPGPDLGIVRAKNSFGLEVGPATDGREKVMRNLVCARLIDYVGRFGAAPSAEELFDDSWHVYEQQVDLSKPGRGRHEFMDKCRYTVGRFLRGEIRGVETLEKAVEVYRLKKEARQDSAKHSRIEEDIAADPADTFELLSVGEIKKLPDPLWIVSGLVPEGGLGFIFGPPGCGKSFIGLGMALSVAARLPEWWGRSIKKHGAVIYISSEGHTDLKNRIMAWEQATGCKADDVPFYLIRQSINFMSPGDVEKLLRTIQAVADKAGAPVMVFVDTVSRVLPGADENLQKDMTLFISACDLVREKFGATVVGIHHTSRNGNLRGSTVFDGAGDFLAQIERDEGAAIGTLTAKKIKAAQDGWKQAFRLDQVPVGDIAGTTSLVASACAQDAANEGNKWPDRDTCQRVLGAIREAWDAGRPWSSYPHAKKHGRYAPVLLSQGFNVKPQIAEQMIETWLMRDVLTVEIRDNHSKQKGLKVIGGID